MPIDELTNDDVNQTCASCRSTRRIALGNLIAGDEGPTPESSVPNVVRLPPCASCGAVEFLIRSPDEEAAHPSPGCFGHLHRMLVDQLHAELVQRKRVIGALKDKPAIAKPISKDDVMRWFPKGLKIEMQEMEPLLRPVS